MYKVQSDRSCCTQVADIHDYHLILGPVQFLSVYTVKNMRQYCNSIYIYIKCILRFTVDELKFQISTPYMYMCDGKTRKKK